MPVSLRYRLILVLLSFVLIVLVSVGATYWGLEAQRQDALVINLAGRQRMLIRQMASLALAGQAQVGTLNPSFFGISQDFEQTLVALRDGGSAPYLPDGTAYLPGTHKPEIRAALDQLESDWQQARPVFVQLLESQPGNTVNSESAQAVRSQTELLTTQADLPVRLFQAEAAEKINLLRWVQIGFLCAALILLSLGAIMMRKSLLEPLDRLRQAAISIGNNNLSEVVSVRGPQEIKVLASALDTMRANLETVQHDLAYLNESLEGRVAQRTLELEVLEEVALDITSNLDLPSVLSSIAEKAQTLLHADVASICLLDDDYRHLQLKAHRGVQEALVGNSVQASDAFVAGILNRHSAALCSEGTNIKGCRMLAPEFLASHLAAPLKVGQRQIGVLCVGSSMKGFFNPEDAKTLTKLAATASVAVENARLYAEAEKVAVLEERSRIAAEIHDGLGQTLSYLGLMMDQATDLLLAGRQDLAVERLQYSRQRVEQAAREMRKALHSLLDLQPGRLDLSDYLRKIVDEFSSRHNFQVEWHNGLATGLPCSREMQEHICRIVQEALSNAHRHASASQISVSLSGEQNRYAVNVCDNGKGFTYPLAENAGHYGLRIMQARASHVGANLVVESSPGMGTTIKVEWQS